MLPVGNMLFQSELGMNHITAISQPELFSCLSLRSSVYFGELSDSTAVCKALSETTTALSKPVRSVLDANHWNGFVSMVEFISQLINQRFWPAQTG